MTLHTLTLQPDETLGVDTFIHSGLIDFDFGGDGSIQVGDGASPTAGNHKGLIKFDLSSIPSDAVIQTAVLTLTMNGAGASSAVVASVEAHRGLVTFFEGPSAGSNLSGSPSTVASTWHYRNNNGAVAWTGGQGGGSGTDYAAAITAATNVSGTGGTFTWDLKTDVVNFVSGAQTNLGWWLLVASGTNTYKNFFSSSSGTAGNRPKLVITYKTYTTVTITPEFGTGKDTYIEQANPTFNFGGSASLKAGSDGAALAEKGFVRFDLSAIPTGATITAATLKLTCTSELSTVDQTLAVYRMLIDWYEGSQNGAAPGAGENASTWNLLNVNGSTAWPSGAGMGSAGNGVETAVSQTGSVVITAPSTEFSVSVLADVQAFIAGTFTNYGWSLRSGAAANATKTYASSENGTVLNRPKLVVVYEENALPVLSPDSSRGETVVGSILAGSTIAPAVTADGVAGTAGPTVEIGGLTFLGGQASAGGFTVAPDVAIAASLSPNPAQAHSTTVGPTSIIKGSAALTPAPAGAVAGNQGPASLVDLSLRPAAATAISSTAVTVIAQRIFPQVCTPDPILLITDGSLRPNGQLNQLSLLSNGFLLNDWKPNISQYKDGGVWSDSALAEGRSLARRSFGNGLEVMDMRGTGKNQDNMVWFMQQLFQWQELAADYWVSDWGNRPIFLIAKAAKETNPRFAMIKAMSVPELANPYAQPFYSRNGKSTIEPFTLRIERGHWLSTPPGLGDCVPLSSTRSWTVQGWSAGNTSGGGSATISGAVLTLVQLSNGDILAGTDDQAQVYRSSDNGATWIQIAKIGATTDAINKLVVTRAGNVFAAVTGSSASRGIWKSANNGGVWTKVYNDASGQGFLDIGYAQGQGFLTAVGGSTTAETNNIVFSNNEGLNWGRSNDVPTPYQIKSIAFQEEPVLASSYPNQPASAFNVQSAGFFGTNGFYTTAGVGWMDAAPPTTSPTSISHMYTPGSGQMGNGGLDMAVFLHATDQGRYYRKALWAVKSAADVTDTEIWQWPNPAGGFNFGKLATIDNKVFNTLYVDPVAWQSIPAQRTIWAGANGEIWVSYNNGLGWTLASDAPVHQIRSLLRTTSGALLAGGDSGEVFIYTGSSGSQGGGTHTDPAIGSSVVVNSYTLGMEESCDDAVFAANKSSFSNLTHVLHYNGSTYTELQFATEPPYSFLGSTAVVNKAVYFGSKTSDSNVPGGTFSNVIFELTQIAQNITVVWEFWNGSSWVSLTVQDSSAGFKTLGVGSVHFVIPTTWATVAINGVTCYWIRARISAVAANPVTPIHDNIHTHRWIYTANLPYVEVSASGVTGDLPANAQVRWHNRADDPGATIDLETDRTVCGLRSVARGPYFNSYLNISDTQIPFGVSIAKDSDGSWGGSLRAPTNRALTISYSSGGRLNTWNDLATFTLAHTVAHDYYGTYRAFVRCYKYGTGTSNWQVRLRTTFGTGGSQNTSKVQFPGTGNDWEVLDLGPVTIPSTQVSFISNNYCESLTLTVQGYCTATGIGLVLYDLILIPTDEWGIDTVSASPSASNAGKVVGDSYLDIDSITNPKALISSTNRNGANQIVSRYQAVSNGPAILQSKQQQRLWFLTMSYEGYWRAYPEIAGSVQAFKQQKYLFARGFS